MNNLVILKKKPLSGLKGNKDLLVGFSINPEPQHV